MAANVPAALKSADIARFAHRAAQLEKAKPVVAYWCNYWIVNQILSKGLHSADQECNTYTTNLVDKLEQFKGENQTNDAVIDDMAGKAYVEQFGLETFSRADNAVRANKASKQTADTFQASATFLDLLQIWGKIDPEIVAKIKYAKYHALRIAKAIKAGEDPNLSNPKIEPEEETLPPLDADDTDLHLINGYQEQPRHPSVVEVPDEADRLQRNLAERSHLDESLHPSRDPSVPRQPGHKGRQPSIEHIPDEAHHIQSHLAKLSSNDESLHPSRAPSVPPPGIHDVSPIAHPNDSSSIYHSNAADDVTAISPISPTAAVESGRKSSIGGNYFPQIPTPLSQPTAPFDLPAPPSEPTPRHPNTFLHTNSMPPEPPVQKASPPPPERHHGHFLPATQPIPPALAPQSTPRRPIPQAPPQLQSSRAPVEVNEEAIMKAQKHARWAISALNFEDVPTAVKELKGALQTLGAL